MLSMDANVGN